jgi:3-oxoadipate enol-lactonase
MAVFLTGMETAMTRHFCPDGGLSYLRAGPADGVPVLLIHGLGWDAERLWTGVLERLSDRGYHVIAPDLKGVGRSAVLEAPVTISNYADDLTDLLAVMEIREPVIIGFSLGVMIAVELYGRASLRPRALVLACGLVTAGKRDGTEAMLARALTLGPTAFATEQAQAVFGAAFKRSHPDVVADFVQWRSAMDQSSLHHAFRAAYGFDLSSELTQISCPTLVMAAEDDPFVDPDLGRAMAGRIPGAEFLLIEGCGHMAPIEQPATFEQAILDHLTHWGTA